VIVFAVKNADPGWPVQLVAGECVKVAVDVADVDIAMDGGLRAVD
jgi:hypothetical protein